jgi:hypothetical protein
MDDAVSFKSHSWRSSKTLVLFTAILGLFTGQDYLERRWELHANISCRKLPLWIRCPDLALYGNSINWTYVE